MLRREVLRVQHICLAQVGMHDLSSTRWLVRASWDLHLKSDGVQMMTGDHLSARSPEERVFVDGACSTPGREDNGGLPDFTSPDCTWLFKAQLFKLRPQIAAAALCCKHAVPPAIKVLASGGIAAAQLLALHA